ncbi:RseA family anti-sigma factor [Luteimonas yanweni]
MSTLMTNDYDDIDFEPAPPDKLYAHNRRQLSAMLDGELSPDQARFMLRRLQHDAELATCWERWQVCGEVLRGRGHALLPADFSSRVARAIAAPEATATASAAGHARTRRARTPRLLRWGGGALAASVALVALFMARQLPDAQAPELATASSTSMSAPAMVERDGVASSLAHATDAGRTGDDAAPAATGTDPAPGLLAAAAPLAIAVAEAPRRAADRGSTRSQAQRAAARRSQGVADAPVRAVARARLPVAPPVPAHGVGQGSRPAAVDPVDVGLPALAALPSAALGGEALFGAPEAATRPWPRATLSGLPGTRPFAASYGLQQADAFAPFQPRLDAAPAAAKPLPVHPVEADPR